MFRKELPLFRPEIKSVSFGHVRQDGYVCYMRNYYFAGFENTGKDILIVNDMGKRIYLKHDTTTLKSIVDYDLDKDIVTPHYHKADKFKTQKENITGRDKTVTIHGILRELNNLSSKLKAFFFLCWVQHNYSMGL